MNKIHVFSHMDLDGVTSFLVLKWFFQKNISATFTTANRFGEDFEKFIEADGLKNYDKIFILDLDVSAHADIVDHEKVSIYDHHSTNNAVYKRAKGGIRDCTSTAKLVYQIFSKLPGSEFSNKQKKLIALADDYDSYTLAAPQSMELNTILFESQNKPWNFIKDFENGFDGFNELQQNIIYLHNRKRERVIKDLPEIYSGSVKIQGKDRKVVATFAGECINEVADYITKKFDAEVSIVVNPKNNHISFRRGLTTDVDVSKLAETLCGGGGRAETAGGEADDPKFLAFTKLLAPIKA